MFADIGKTGMLGIVKLRFTTASVSQFKRIREDKQLSEAVHTLIWDIDTWRMGQRVQVWSQWLTYCEDQANMVGADPDQSTLYERLAADRNYYEAYLIHVNDEYEAVEEMREFLFHQPVVVLGLPNLQNLHITCNRRQSTKLPLKLPLIACKGDRSVKNVSLIRPPSIHATVASAKEVWYDGLDFPDMFLLNACFIPNGACTNMTRITIQPGELRTLHSAKLHYSELIRYVHRWRNLRSLHLDFGSHELREHHTRGFFQYVQKAIRFPWTTTNSRCSRSPTTRPELRELTLRHFDTTSNTLLSLIARHNSKLRELKLHNTTLFPGENGFVPHYSWPQIFQIVGSITDLDDVVFSGKFSYHSGITTKHSWDFDDASVARTVASGIINERKRIGRRLLGA